MNSLMEHPLAIKAQQLTSSWYQPHPGIRQHDQVVANVINTHFSQAEPELITSALIAHSFALAPKEIDLNELLASHLSPGVASIVTTLEKEYDALNTFNGTNLEIYLRALINSSPGAAFVSAADKIVTLTTLLKADYDLVVFNCPQRAFPALKTYYDFFCHYARPHLSASLADELTRLIATIPH